MLRTLALVAAVLGPLWKPAARRWGRPAAKAALKQGFVAYELGRERLAEAGEQVADMLAEVQVELATERTRPMPEARAMAAGSHR